MKKTFWLAVLILGLGAAALWHYQRDGAPATGAAAPPSVILHTAEERLFSDRIEALGTLQGRESVTITANVTETVADIHFEEGQRVERGQLLVSLSQQEELAQLGSARAELDEQRREVKRLEGLVKTQSAARTELDQRRTALDMARHRIEELQAVIAERNVRAPFDGVLGLRHVSPGALVQPGDTITTLDAIDSLKMDFSVPATALASLEVGQAISATTAAYPREFTGTVTVIDSRVNPVDRSIRARAYFDNPEGMLKPGMLMQLELHYLPRRALLIPEEALVSREREHTVWVVDPQSNEATPRTVSIGGRRAGWVEITEGLAAGERVVREGMMRLRPGVQVAVKNTGGET